MNRQSAEGGSGVAIERSEIDEAVRRYFSQLARRYIGLVAGAVALVLIAVLMPTKSNTVGTNGAGTSSNVAAGTVAGPNAAGSDATATGAPAAGGAGASGGTGSARGTSRAAGGGAGSVGGAAPIAGGVTVGSGVARNGVTCTPGARQVHWTVYAAPCVGAWQGNNGGGTSRGVTDKTITLVLRKFKECAGGALTNCDAVIADYRAWIDLFNKNYELYGRQVELKVFDGQGSFVAEVEGQGQGQAQADAQAAYDLGAFSTLAIGGDFPPWYQALANKRIIDPGVFLPASKSLRDYAPYLYVTPFASSVDNWSRGAAAVACGRMNGLPAVFSPDALFKRTNRVFGLLNPDSPDWGTGVGLVISEGKSRCGLKITQHSTYSVATGNAEAAPIVTRMKAAGVTTILSTADNGMQPNLMKAANAQSYFPEWINFESFMTSRAAGSGGQFLLKLAPQGPFIAPQEQEGWKAYQLQKPGQIPPTYVASAPTSGYASEDGFFYQLLYVMNAIQMAGPNLTPATFAKAYTSMPSSTGPVYGTWYSDKQDFQAPMSSFAIARWDAKVKSKMDGNLGDWVTCNGDTRYLYPEVNNIGTGQLQC
jgi:hypothetical protein